MTVLTGAQSGRYPSGNSLLLRGEDQTVLVDPSLDVSVRGGAPEPVDRVVLSHAHEDHVAGLHRFPDAEVLVHLEFLAEPGSLADMVDHRFVYRRHVELPFADSVERHTARRHLDRMLADGRVTEVEPGRYSAVSALGATVRRARVRGTSIGDSAGPAG